MKKLLLFTMLLGYFAAYSQGTVTGTVADSDLGGPLPGANVLESGTSNGTVQILTEISPLMLALILELL